MKLDEKLTLLIVILLAADVYFTYQMYQLMVRNDQR